MSMSNEKHSKKVCLDELNRDGDPTLLKKIMSDALDCLNRKI